MMIRLNADNERLRQLLVNANEEMAKQKDVIANLQHKLKLIENARKNRKVKR